MLALPALGLCAVPFRAVHLPCAEQFHQHRPDPGKRKSLSFNPFITQGGGGGVRGRGFRRFRGF